MQNHSGLERVRIFVPIPSVVREKYTPEDLSLDIRKFTYSSNFENPASKKSDRENGSAIVKILGLSRKF